MNFLTFLFLFQVFHNIFFILSLPFHTLAAHFVRIVAINTRVIFLYYIMFSLSYYQICSGTSARE